MEIDDELNKTLEKYPHFNEFLKKQDKYILDENKNVIKADLMTWGKFLEGDKKIRIVKQETINDLWISTVFLGLDHKFSLYEEIEKDDYKPDIFETMIFKDGRNIYLDRYSTWQEAEEGHKKAVEWVNNGCKEDET